jgi:hypothetical protein
MKALYCSIFLSFAMTLTSCGGSYYIVQPAGELTMVSTRNYETKVEYSKLKTYAGVDRSQIDNAIANSKGGKIKRKSVAYKEINTFKAKSLQESVDAVVKSVSGGEYLSNVKVYSVYQFSGRNLLPTTFFMASGDVWGTKSQEDNIKGFKVGDKVIFTYTKEIKSSIGKVFRGKYNNQYTGKILELKSATAIVSLESGEVVEIPYVNLVRL